MIAQFLTACLCGGLGGAVFTWIVNRRFRQPPVLGLRLLREEGEKGKIRYASHNGIEERSEEARYYHIRVSNERRWSPANDVQVFLIRLEEPGPDEALQVMWVGEVPMQWRHQEVSPLTRTIGHDADCDLCSVGKGKWLSLMPLIIPLNLNARRQERCRMVASFLARSTQVDSPILRIEIAWDGDWEDGDIEMQRHLKIRPLGT